jgi:hypothetical protein
VEAIWLIVWFIRSFKYIYEITDTLQHICKLYVLILYSLALMSPWGWRFIAWTCRRVHAYGWFVILYKLCAFVGVCGWLFSFVYFLFFPRQPTCPINT